MALLIPIHIIAGFTGLASGAAALWSRKGERLHRQSGLIFVYAMMVLGASGAAMSVLESQRITVITSMLAFYLVTSSLLTIRRRVRGFDWMHAGLMLVGLALGLRGITLGIEGLNSASGEIDGYPPAIGFIFGGVALLAALGDIRMMLVRGIRETHRLARHLWRMCFALFMAAGSFFLGQADMFPELLRNSCLLSIPVLLVLLLMFYWLARVLFTGWRPHTQQTVQANPHSLQEAIR